MTTTTRFLLSATAGLGFAVFTFASFLATGMASQPTLIGFSGLVICGLVEIALLDYTAPPARVPRTLRRTTRRAGQASRTASFPSLSHHRQAA